VNACKEFYHAGISQIALIVLLQCTYMLILLAKHATGSDVADSYRWSALLQALVWCTAHQQQQRNRGTADIALHCTASPSVRLEVLSELTRVFNLRAKTTIEHQGDAPNAQLLRWLAQAAGAMLLHSTAAAVQLISTDSRTDDTVPAHDDSSSSSSGDAVTGTTATATASAAGVSASSAGVCTAQHLKAAQYLQRAGLCDALDTAAVAQCLADRLLVNTNIVADAATTTATAGAAAEALQHKQRYSSAQLAGMCAATVAAGSSAVGRQLVRALLSSSADTSGCGAAAVAARAEAVKWIVKLRLTDDKEFVPVLLHNSTSSSCTYSDSSTVAATAATAAVHGGAQQSLLPVLALPPASELAVVLVCGAASLALARSVLLPLQQHTNKQTVPVVVGIDTEWRPFSTGQQRTRVSLVQVACSTHAFLFDLMSLEHGWSPTTTGTTSNSSKTSISTTITETSDVHMQQEESNGNNVVTELYRELMQELLTSERVTKLAYGFDNDHR
jgi:hypothetical protein